MPSKRGQAGARKGRGSGAKKKAKKAKPKKKTAPRKAKKAKPKKKPASRKAKKPKKVKKPRSASPSSWPGMVTSVTVPVDTRVYPLEVVYGAAYVLMDRAYVHLEPRGPAGVDVRLAGKEPLDRAGLRALGGEFANELVNQALRTTLDESGRKLREYIVAKAHFFQEDGARNVQRLLDATMQEAFDEDPLDIAVPWEEKYGGGGTGKD
jgi:His-Xaa-Ser system protein HxsD